MKINYAPNTIFIVGPIQRSVMLIQNSKGQSLNEKGISKGIEYHCKKCKEIKLSILN